MKLRCPRCQKKLSVPDKYAGKAIRCPSCNKGFTVPKTQAAMEGPATRSGLNLEDLAKLEAGSMEMDVRDREEAESATATQREREEADAPQVRTCPSCRKQVPVDDPYAEMLCSHCWNPIPALIKGTGEVRAERVARSRRKRNLTGAGAFYAELASSVAYPISALGSLATAAGVAVLAGVAPVAVIVGGSSVMEQSAVGTIEGVQKADLSGATKVLMAVFAAEVVFFSAVALHAFLDCVRATSIGNDRAPNLSWSPTQWGKSFLAYLVLAIYLCVATAVVTQLSVDDPLSYVSGHDVMGLLKAGGAGFAVGMVIVTFAIPMNLIGISLGSIAQGLNPSNVFKAVGKTHGHYVFLLLIVSVFGAMFATAFSAIAIDWFLPQVDVMIKGSKEGNIGEVALSMAAWGGVMGVFFYGTYILARLHGLFARAFHKSLGFGGGR